MMESAKAMAPEIRRVVSIEDSSLVDWIETVRSCGSASPGG